MTRPTRSWQCAPAGLGDQAPSSAEDKSCPAPSDIQRWPLDAFGPAQPSPTHVPLLAAPAAPTVSVWPSPTCCASGTAWLSTCTASLWKCAASSSSPICAATKERTCASGVHVRRWAPARQEAAPPPGAATAAQVPPLGRRMMTVGCCLKGRRHLLPQLPPGEFWPHIKPTLSPHPRPTRLRVMGQVERAAVGAQRLGHALAAVGRQLVQLAQQGAHL